MHKEYTYLDDKVIISDENNNKIIRNYSNNIDKVLVKENLIEVMEDKIEELKKKSISYQNNRYIPYTLPLITLISIVGGLLMGNLLSNTDLFTKSIDTIFQSVNKTMVCSSVLTFIPLGAFLEVNNYKKYKITKKEQQAITNEISFLKKKLKKEKESLKNIKIEQSNHYRNEIENNQTYKINDLEQLKKLRNELQFFYDLGYNQDKYSKYYLNNKLDKKLQKKYTKEQLEITKEYIKEKNPTCVLKQKKNHYK